MAEPLHRKYRFNKDYFVLGALVAAALVLRCGNIRLGFWWDVIWSTLEYAKASSGW